MTYIFSGQDQVPEKYQTIHESNKTSTYISKPSSTDFGREAVVIEKKKPKPGTCLTWKREHFKTFDGKIIRLEALVVISNYIIVIIINMSLYDFNNNHVFF